MAIAQYLADFLGAAEYAFVTHRVPSRHVKFYHAHGSLGSGLGNAVILWHVVSRLSLVRRHSGTRRNATYMYARVDDDAELVVFLLLAEVVGLASLHIDAADLDAEDVGQNAELDAASPHTVEQTVAIPVGTGTQEVGIEPEGALADCVDDDATQGSRGVLASAGGRAERYQPTQSTAHGSEHAVSIIRHDT